MNGKTHVFQGMQRDNHPIRQVDNALWNAHNIRLTCREDNTMVSITNEQGTSDPLLSFEGLYVGHCVIGKYLVVFTAEKPDDNGVVHNNWIYRVERKDNGEYLKIILFSGNLNIHPDSPIETLGLYETELIQKVYWIDDRNSPRVINVTQPEYKFSEEDYKVIMIDGVNLSNTSLIEDQDLERLLEYYCPHGMWKNTSFDFIQSLNLKETVNIRKTEVSGIFSPGTIQYAFTYYNKYGAETNIFYTTPLYYIAHKDRGGSPEDKISCGFEIRLNNLDNFEYVRVYSIHRTSIDAIPTVKIVTDLPITLNHSTGDTLPITYVDNGTSGSIEDPTYLLYLGGKDIIAKTLAQKNGTLFLGNIKLNSLSNFNDSEISGEVSISDDPVLLDTIPEIKRDSSYYIYDKSLINYTGAFKAREIYRCGFQVQDSKGVWSEPIYIEDKILCNNLSDKTFSTKNLCLTPDGVNRLIEKGGKRVRTCIVFPRTFERSRLCQGILCPTVYSVNGRKNNSPYAASSWFFRPASDRISSSDINLGEFIEYAHDRALKGNRPRGVEIQSMCGKSPDTAIGITDTEAWGHCFYVDENLVTFHSPDVEFDTNIQNLSFEHTRLEIIGTAKLGAISGDIDIKTSSPTRMSYGGGFQHTTIGYPLNINTTINGGLVAGLFYKDQAVYKKDNTTESALIWNFMVYPWQGSGSLNNDEVREAGDGTQSSVLKTKTISNLKFFSDNDFILNTSSIDISTPALFMSDEVSLLKVRVPYMNSEVNYYGNVDTLLTMPINNAANSVNDKYKGAYPILGGKSFNDEVVQIDNFFPDPEDLNKNLDVRNVTSNPIRMKYKSSPHLVFSLGKKDTNLIELLPRYKDESLDRMRGDVSLPEWVPNSSVKLYDRICYYGMVPNYFYDENPIKGSLWYCLGEAKNADISGKFYLYYCKSVTNVTRFGIVSEIPDNLIVKAVPRLFHKTDTFTPPGYKEEEWDGNTYVGKNVKYYKIVNDGESITKLPFCKLEEYNPNTGDNTEDSNKQEYKYKQDIIEPEKVQYSPYLLIAELVQDIPDDIRFGGKSEEALRNNLWFPSSEPINLVKNTEVKVPYRYGDTWYSRYDCLKTYPFTKEDENQIVEIGSFMCETRVNIDGRYDRNRGKLSNLTMSPQNFNLINEVYSQKDNFFNYRILDKDFYKQDTFSNQILWSKQKIHGEDIDTWTNVTLASTYDIDGDKGQITALKTFNNTLLCFQEKAINQISFNERVQIPTSDGTPIEISNNYKMEGSIVINSSIGCQDKWTIVTTPLGIYFIDYNSNSLYLYNGQLANLGSSKGMTWWLRQNSWSKNWKPSLSSINGIRSFYDKKFGDVYFTPGLSDNEYDALCYSETIQGFSSLMSYGGTSAMFNFDDGFYSLRTNNRDTVLYQNNVGKYNNFYGINKGWSFSFIENDNPTYTKVFDTVETRADVYKDNKLLNICPFNFIEAENEYQYAKAIVDNRNMRKKFRIWRGFIPRASDTSKGERSIYGRARIRNPWARITLGYEPKGTEDNNKVVIHDIDVKYII